MSEANLISKSSGSGASKIYHVGRIAEVEEGCEMLHTFEEGSVSCTDTCVSRGVRAHCLNRSSAALPKSLFKLKIPQS